MNINWNTLMERLSLYPPGIHDLRPPCSNEELERLRNEIGQLPNALSQMLRQFNGGKLFVAPDGGGAMITLFTSADLPPLPPLIESSGFSIDKFTHRWRSATSVSRDRSNDWAIGMMNYGGLIILDADSKIREWDTAQSKWDPREWEFNDWIEYIMRKGDAYLKES